MARQEQDESTLYKPEYHPSVPGDTKQSNEETSNLFNLDTDRTRGSSSSNPQSAMGHQSSPPVIGIASKHFVTSPGQPTTLVCKVTSESAVDVKWFHKGQELCNDSRFCAMKESDFYYLYIDGTCSSDEGEYKVVVSNEQGSTQTTIRMSVMMPLPPNRDENHKAVPLKEFPAFLSGIRGTRAMMMEFFDVEKPWDFSQYAATLPCNEYKNRYCNVFPYDHTRVVLSLQAGVPGSDYVNASYMDEGSTYIASQGPIPNTFNDFWRMVWECNIHVIAMVTKVKEKNSVKCHQYWPTQGATKYGNYVIEFNGTEKSPFFTTTTFTITPDGSAEPAGTVQSRKVCHFQFLGWPEYGVPDNPAHLLEFRKRAIDYHATVTGPLLVHCSAGVGRTGTFLCIDMILKRMEADGGTVDIFNLIRQLRYRRERTVETPEQYVFIHDAIAEVLRTRSH